MSSLPALMGTLGDTGSFSPPEPLLWTDIVQYPVASQLVNRKKGLGTKTWLIIDSTGQAQSVDAGKTMIMHRTGLSARDLRILDPLLSYPSTLTVRERALVINLEHVKGIITAQEVWLLNARDPAVAPLGEELRRRLLRYHQANAVKDNETGVKYEEEQTEEDLHQVLQAISSFRRRESLEEQRCDISKKTTLPFEFVVLEACLEAVCSSLDDEAKALEQEAYPALDKLISKITTPNLEQVRQIKGRLVTLTGRVQKIRDEFERLLENDEDMAEMYLTNKIGQEEYENNSCVSSITNDDEDECDGKLDMDEDREDEEIVSNGRLTSLYSSQHDKIERVKTAGSLFSMLSQRADVAELEMLLEAYFVHAEGTLNKLSTLNEYIGDSEDYVNITLNDKQNHVLQMGIVMKTATIVVTATVVTTNILSMNVIISLFRPPVPTINNWLYASCGSLFGAIFLYVILMLWYKNKGFLLY